MADAHSTEVWKPIPTWEGKYEVSSHGRVRSLRFVNGRTNRLRREPLVLSPNRDQGYRRVRLVDQAGDRDCHLRVAVLVLTAFVSPRPDGMEAAHLNGNRADDRFENLEWTTHIENESHKEQHGTIMRGARNGMAKLTADAVADIRTSSLRDVQLAKIYGVTKTLIGMVRKNRIWKQVG